MIMGRLTYETIMELGDWPCRGKPGWVMIGEPPMGAAAEFAAVHDNLRLIERNGCKDAPTAKRYSAVQGETLASAGFYP
jgi:hypothetical protein